MERINVLHAGCKFMLGNVEIENYFCRVQGVISRTTIPMLGLFVLILMHFYADSKYGNVILNFDFFF